MIQVTAFKWVPPFAQGSVRDIRVRWALEEAGLGYDDQLIGFEDQSKPAYRARQPFGQVPVYSDGKVEMFESGAIVLWIAQRSDQLMPSDDAGRAIVMTWLFAAMNSVEPFVAELAGIDLFNADKAWAKARRPEAEAFLRVRLGELQAALGDRQWFANDRFSAADILMAHVLRDLRHTDIVADFPRLAGYVSRAEARPAFQRALADQLRPFHEHEAAERAAVG
ncbi:MULTISPECIES: glutathione S-transferase family protein [unclassified Brevundimonas]|uniref:glutathione S-transferase family protein n=1 Tax=unclassified Brevundimonas TaxID=2622653 RepID=UPI000CFBE717|nr:MULTISPECIES: glutathione S-transferase family protein [unclassified Brevundimonas]PRA29543.1 glutathione S-transferase [Brevundimonas sp. MYb27]PQZ83660.1 glutathione S-transferase [Brevundimonas sp. MYb31]PRB15751.1 glutathione S-transferase [Brevundimonas sp. MYb52]PRB36248.1 glutathione S-transferase [Brevundimonas sp. MYb46]PRB46842.1 glutathione S-transferase [Brevundimonas sp. MYb33]